MKIKISKIHLAIIADILKIKKKLYCNEEIQIFFHYKNK